LLPSNAVVFTGTNGRIVGDPDRGTGIGCSRGAFYEYAFIYSNGKCGVFSSRFVDIICTVGFANEATETHYKFMPKASRRPS
jgi:hypothetical protein